jgi:hypothetical protein
VPSLSSAQRKRTAAPEDYEIGSSIFAATIAIERASAKLAKKSPKASGRKL